MPAPRRRLVPLLLLAALATGCAPAAQTAAPDAADAAPDSSSDTPVAEATTDPDGATAEVAAGFGCSDEMLTYLAQNGMADVPPADPSTFTFPAGVDIAADPTCYVSDGDESPSRHSALFYDDPSGVMTQVTDAFAAAGWQANVGGSLVGDMGVWWSDGAEVTAAKYAVGGGVLDIDGRTAAWYSWGS